MTQNKQKDSEESDYDSHSLPSYSDLSKAFYDMHDDTLKYLKKIPSKNQKILKLEEKS